MIVLTKSSMFIIKWIADILGLLMNGIYIVLQAIGIENVGLAIILFTIVIYLALTPLTIKQQKFTRLSAQMQPEIKKVQQKYQGRKDQLSMQKQQEEVQLIYQKYGVSATGSCVQLLIQMPILFALYQVIYHIPGYISAIGSKITTVAETSGVVSFITNWVNDLGNNTLTRTLSDGEVKNVVDVIYNLNTNNWAQIISDSVGKDFAGALENVHTYLTKVTYFLGLNIADTPSNIFMTAWKDKSFLMIFVAILIPVLAYATQVLNMKLTQYDAGGKKDKKKKNTTEIDTTAATMKSMNLVMPIMSAVFCFTLPVGIGIYWIAGAVIRTIQALFINKHFDHVGIDKLIEEGQKKAEKKRKKHSTPYAQVAQNATMSTRHLDIDKKIKDVKNIDTGAAKGTDDNQNFAAGSIAARAHMAAGLDNKKNKGKKK